MNKINLILIVSCFIPLLSWANSGDDLSRDFDSLGGNKILLDKAKALNPEIEVGIVQDRTVSRRNRFEISPEVLASFGGDTYSRTQGLALNGQFHINPRWSLGLKYTSLFNSLTREGEAMVDRAWAEYQKNPKQPGVEFPEMDFPLEEKLATVSWYPIYGKLNLLDQKVIQFDVYGLLGAGTVKLKSGDSTAKTAGLGMGFWINPRTSARVELRYEGYQARYYTGPKDLDLAMTSFQMGWLL